MPLYTLSAASDLDQHIIRYDSRLDHAIINLLNNAADASPEQIGIVITLDEQDLIWDHQRCRRRDSTGCFSATGQKPVSAQR